MGVLVVFLSYFFNQRLTHISTCLPSHFVLACRCAMVWMTPTDATPRDDGLWTMDDGSYDDAYCRSLLNRYHMKDIIIGKVYFLLVRIKIKHMEVTKTHGLGPL